MRQELKYLTIATRTTSPSSIIKAPQKDMDLDWETSSC